jgi:HK97 family phage prohead protease
VDMETRLVKGLISVAVPDLDSEVVLPSGLDRSYFPDKVKSVYFGHDYSQMPVGRCAKLKAHGDAMWAVTRILPGPRGDDLLVAMQEEAVNGFSIGFRPDDMGEPSKEEIRKYGYHDRIIRKAKLIEYSVVSMPACPLATIDMKGQVIGKLDELLTKGKIRRSSAVEFGLPESAEPKTFAVRPRRAFVVDGAVVVR